MTDTTEDPTSRRRLGRRGAGLVAIAVAVVGTLALTFVPAPYVIEKPGPVYNTLGTVEGNSGSKIPLIKISGTSTYPTTGDLSMLTVYAVGSPESSPSWLEVIAAWMRPDYAVVPMDLMFPNGMTRDQSATAAKVQMDTSQQEAIAAALTKLGIGYTSKLTVVETMAGYPAASLLKAGDIVNTADGQPVHDVSALRSIIKGIGIGNSVQLGITRSGVDQTVTAPVVASTSDGKTPVVGILTGGTYSFPFDVSIELNNVGGSSAGMMFALGIIDELTPGSLTGGQNIAGTGEISADGTVGPIGGIVQKAYGARASGARWLLVPADNCADLVGHVPEGLRDVRVSTLSDAYSAVQHIARHRGTSSLPYCAPH